jgi:thiol-disulfide isomerase/thioredoxin
MRLMFTGLWVALALVVGCSGGTDPADGAWAPRDGAYPSGPYGTTDNATITNHAFVLPDGSKFGVLEDPTAYTLHDNIFKPGAKVLLLVTAAEWCTACREEAPKLQSLYQDLHEQGLEIVTAIFEDADTGPADQSHAETWVRLYGLTHPVVADPTFHLGEYYDPNNTPLVMIIDVDDMSIKYKGIGFAETDVRAIINALL